MFGEIVGDMTSNFSRKEFECKCGCGLDAIDPALVARLQETRNSTGLKIIINSGCRCENHNINEGGKANSSHTPRADGLCKAADIDCTDSCTRFFLLRDLIRRFRRIEVRSTWIHVDIDEMKAQDVVFLE